MDFKLRAVLTVRRFWQTPARSHKLSETSCQPASIALCSDQLSTFYYQLDFRAILRVPTHLTMSHSLDRGLEDVVAGYWP